MNILKMGSFNDVPDIEIHRMDFKNKSNAEKEKMILGIAQNMISRVVDLSVSFTCASQVNRTNKDHVFEYACEVVSLGLLFLNFRDTIQEGDGERIMLCLYLNLLTDATIPSTP